MKSTPKTRGPQKKGFAPPLGAGNRASYGRSRSPTHSVPISTYVEKFVDTEGMVNLGRVAEAFRMSRAQLAETAGLATSTALKAGRQGSPKAQSRVTEMLEIISRIQNWASSEAAAMAWYRSQPIPALNGRTPEALVKDGRAGAVREYLDHLALGGFA